VSRFTLSLWDQKFPSLGKQHKPVFVLVLYSYDIGEA